MNTKEQWEEELIEKLASIEHDRWAGWQKYMHSLCTKNHDGTLTIPIDRVERWERQIGTRYDTLPEREKEYDRIEVRKYLPILLSEIQLAEQKAREGERERIIDIINNITSMYVSLPSEEIKEMLYKDNIINQINNSK